VVVSCGSAAACGDATDREIVSPDLDQRVQQANAVQEDKQQAAMCWPRTLPPAVGFIRAVVRTAGLLNARLRGQLL
jgi:hypothetical protein